MLVYTQSNILYGVYIHALVNPFRMIPATSLGYNTNDSHNICCNFRSLCFSVSENLTSVQLVCSETSVMRGLNKHMKTLIHIRKCIDLLEEGHW